MGSYNVLLSAMSCSTFYVGITITPLKLIDTFNNKRQIPSRIKKQTFAFHLSHTKLSCRRRPMYPLIFYEKSCIKQIQDVLPLLMISHYLVVHEDSNYCKKHSENIGHGDWVLQCDQRDCDDADSLRGISNRIAEWRYHGNDCESYHILGEVTESVD